MDEIRDFLTGPTGGIMAFCFMTGVGVGWGICQKLIVEEYRRRVIRLEAKIDALWNRADFDAHS